MPVELPLDVAGWFALATAFVAVLIHATQRWWPEVQRWARHTAEKMVDY